MKETFLHFGVFSVPVWGTKLMDAKEEMKVKWEKPPENKMLSRIQMAVTSEE